MVLNRQSPVKSPVKSPSKLRNANSSETPAAKRKLDLEDIKEEEEEEEEEEEKDQQQVKAAVLADFNDFWGEEVDSVEKKVERRMEERSRASAASKGQEFNLSTPPGSPRLSKGKSAKSAPLKVYKVATPPSSPRQEPAPEKPVYVPPWPYGSKWPFCCAPTTLELRGLPRGCTAQVIIAQLATWKLSGRCNLVYAPSSQQAGGYAVVNTARHADGCTLANRLHGFADWKCVQPRGGNNTQQRSKAKVTRVTWCFTCQGLDALVMQYHHDPNAWGYSKAGRYDGPWVHHSGAWSPLFSPVHMWPIQWQEWEEGGDEWSAEYSSPEFPAEWPAEYSSPERPA